MQRFDDRFRFAGKGGVQSVARKKSKALKKFKLFTPQESGGGGAQLLNMVVQPVRPCLR